MKSPKYAGSNRVKWKLGQIITLLKSKQKNSYKIRESAGALRQLKWQLRNIDWQTFHYRWHKGVKPFSHTLSRIFGAVIFLGSYPSYTLLRICLVFVKVLPGPFLGLLDKYQKWEKFLAKAALFVLSPNFSYTSTSQTPPRFFQDQKSKRQQFCTLFLFHIHFVDNIRFHK